MDAGGGGSVAKSRRPQIQIFTVSSVLCAFDSMTNHCYLPSIFLNFLLLGLAVIDLMSIAYQGWRKELKPGGGGGGGTFEFSLHTSLKILLISGCSEAIWRSF